MEESALFKLTQGLYILGSRDGDRFVGSAVDAVMQVSNKPLYIVVSCHNTSYTKEMLEACGEFSISILGENSNPFVIGNFGFQSSRTVDKWNNVPFFVEDNLPFLQESIAIIKGKVLSKEVLGTNTLFTAEVVDCRNLKEEGAITYNEYRNGYKNKVFKAMEEYRKTLVKK
ncbi:MAG: flavin reductase family protein [Alphaproteobacteria bacterium]|nr:flavin reductase family protein [Alphaproteobacteria bacterium]